jgi:hypothetical protein
VTAFIYRGSKAPTAIHPAPGGPLPVNPTLANPMAEGHAHAVDGANFLLSMVEARWNSTNGNGSKAESGNNPVQSQKKTRELEKIQRQINKLGRLVNRFRN